MARPKLAKRVKRHSRSVSMTDAAWRAYETRAKKCGYVSVSAYLNDAALGKLPTWPKVK